MGLRDDALLPGTLGQFRKPSLWKLYRWELLAITAGLALQTLFTIALLVQRRRRRLADSVAEKQRLELAVAYTRADESEARIRAILHALPDLMFVQTREGVYLDYYARNPGDLCLPPQSFIGKNMNEVLPRELAEEFRRCFKLAAEATEPVIHEYVLPYDDQTRHYEARMVRHNGDKILTIVRDVTRRKEAEQALQRNQTLLKMITDNCPSMIFLKDPQGRYIYINLKFAEFAHRSVNELIGKTDFEIFPHAQAAVFHSNDLKVLEAGVPLEFEEAAVHDDGSHIGVVCKFPLFDVEGKIYAIGGIVTDITERKRAEGALRESEQLFRNMADHAPVMIWVSNPVGEATYVNKQWTDFTGTTFEQGLGVGWLDSAHPSDRPMVQARFNECISNTKSFRMDYRVRRHDGKYRWVMDSAAPRFGWNGEFLGYIGSVIDITERQQAEDVLRQSEARVRLAMEAARIGYWEVELSTGKLTRSESLERIFGVPPGSLPRSRAAFLALVHPEDRERARLQAQRCIETLEYADVEYRIIRPDGTIRWIASRGQPVLGPDGRVARVLGLCTDITERKETEEALWQSEARFRGIYACNVVPIAFFNLNGQITDANDAYLSLTGYNRTELEEGKLNCGQLTPPEQRYLDTQAIQEDINRDVCTPFETEYVQQSGNRVPVLIGGGTLPGTPPHSVVFAIDLTERKRAEEELRKNEERFQLVLRATEDTIFDWDVTADRLWWNENGQKLFGYECHEQRYDMGWLTELLHPDDRDRAASDRRAIIEGEGDMYQTEYRLRRADRSYAYVHERGFIVRSESGKPARMIGSLTDITEHKRGEEELKAALSEVQQLRERLEAENVYLRSEVSQAYRDGEILGESERIRKVLQQMDQVAGTDMTVLVLGETGTGKELVARALHDKSGRGNRPLVKVNCSTLPAELIESELFGHEKGAFTGATSRQAGRFELADGATIFLDEVGEMPLRLQVKLLRVLQEGEFERLGSGKTFKVDLRVIAATNRNLIEAMQTGRFRADLYYRLNVYPIEVPPLRERKEDIPLLTDAFLREAGRRLGKSFEPISGKVMEALQAYGWPGNIRELQNVIERAAVTSTGRVLQLPEGWASTLTGERSVSSPLGQVARGATVEEASLKELDRKYIVQVLEQTNWRIEGTRGAAVILGLKPSTLRSRMQKLGIRKPTNRERKAQTEDSPAKNPKA